MLLALQVSVSRPATISKAAGWVRVCAGNSTQREMFRGWELPKKRPALGVAMVGDQLFTLLPASLSSPCAAKQVSLFKLLIAVL